MGSATRIALWAVEHARYVEHGFDEARVPGRVTPTLFIGPSLTPRHPLLEVMVEILPPDTIVIFHVMPAREKHLARMDEE